MYPSLEYEEWKSIGWLVFYFQKVDRMQQQLRDQQSWTRNVMERLSYFFLVFVENWSWSHWSLATLYGTYDMLLIMCN